MLIRLPDQENDQWIFDVEAVCKYDCSPGTSDNVIRKIQKVWEDEGTEENRPEEIRVQLLNDGVVADTVYLSAENNWEYTWENLDSQSLWQVAEQDTPEGYTVSVERQGTTFVMTNSAEEKNSGGTELSGSDGKTGADGATIPQTGMLWWPVLLFLCGGLLLLIVGCFLYRGEGKHHDRQ